MQKDLTTGSVFKNVLYFSLPYLLSYFLQTLYGMADLFIIGQFEGTASITAVSIGSQIMHMITVMLVGLAMGVTVGIGRAVGAHDDRGAGAVIGNAVMLFLAVSVVLAAVLTALVQPILSIMSTPAEAVPGAAAYLTICFIGIPCITAYNIIASILIEMKGCTHIKAHPSKSFFHQYRQLREYIGHPAPELFIVPLEPGDLLRVHAEGVGMDGYLIEIVGAPPL